VTQPGPSRRVGPPWPQLDADGPDAGVRSAAALIKYGSTRQWFRSFHCPDIPLKLVPTSSLCTLSVAVVGLGLGLFPVCPSRPLSGLVVVSCSGQAMNV
jgi:hypothetical protein